MLSPFFVRTLVLASVIAAAFISTANAQDISFSVNATFQDSAGTGLLTGTFTIDPTDDAVIAVDLQSSAVGSFPATTFDNDLGHDTFTLYQSYENIYEFDDNYGVSGTSPNGTALNLGIPYPEPTANLSSGFGGSTITYTYPNGLGSNATDIVSGTVTETAVAPEPSSWALLFLGCVGLGFAARARRQPSLGLNSSASV
jgi:hypothetical protein